MEPQTYWMLRSNQLRVTSTHYCRLQCETAEPSPSAFRSCAVRKKTSQIACITSSLQARLNLRRHFPVQCNWRRYAVPTVRVVIMSVRSAAGAADFVICNAPMLVYEGRLRH